MKDLPKQPAYLSEVQYKGDPLISGAVTERAFYALLEGERKFEDISDDYRRNGKTLYAYGYVRYEDIYGRRHCTRYGLRYIAGGTFGRADGWIVDGPDAYNRYS